MHRKLWHTRRIWIHMMAWETWKPCRWFCSRVAVAPVMGIAPSRLWVDVLYQNASYYNQILRNEMFCRKCLKLLPCFEKSIRNVQKVFRIPRKWSIYRGKCRPLHFYRFWVTDTNKTNSGVRWAHITTRNGSSQNRPRPKNKDRKRWIFSISPYGNYVTSFRSQPEGRTGWCLSHRTCKNAMGDIFPYKSIIF